MQKLYLSTMKICKKATVRLIITQARVKGLNLALAEKISGPYFLNFFTYTNETTMQRSEGRAMMQQLPKSKADTQ